MNNSYCLGVDIWEGEADIDFDALKLYGVDFVVIRLNDMNGGHHMDANFTKHWQNAESHGFLHAPYFVYNPWVNGAGNYQWMVAHLPAGYAGRVFIDIEVYMPGYSTTTYAAEVAKFMALCKNPVTPYTGQGYLYLLSSWPKTEYWWAQYLNSFYPSSATVTTWDAVRHTLEFVSEKPTNSYACPGTPKMWQISGDRLIVPGSPKPIDINVFLGNRDELHNYFAGQGVVVPSPVDPEPETEPVKESGLGYYVFDRSAYWYRPNDGPLVIPTYNIPKASGSKETYLGDNWLNYLRITNGSRAYGKIIAPNWGPSKGINSNGKLIFNQLIYPGRNIVEILEVQFINGEKWGRLASMTDQVTPISKTNYIDTPHVVHKVYGCNHKMTYSYLENAPVLPIIGIPRWVQLSWLYPVSKLLPKTVTIRATPHIHIRLGPSVEYSEVGSINFGSNVTVTDITIGSGGIWGRISNGWIALRYRDANLTNWEI